MSIPLLVFFGASALAILGAVLLIAVREPIHSALSLIMVMLALGILYLLLGAEFIAAVQAIVYAGAVMVLFLFVIMMLNAGVEERTNRSRVAEFVGIPLGVVLTIELAYWIGKAAAHGAIISASAPSGVASTEQLSMLLFRNYLFPFEATSILILIAILGAVVLARRQQ
jgi:NADH-quinone oxidoreductase subunit J